jgi:hypothetical protein
MVLILEYVYFEKVRRIIDDHDELDDHKPIITIK